MRRVCWYVWIGMFLYVWINIVLDSFLILSCTHFLGGVCCMGIFQPGIHTLQEEEWFALFLYIFSDGRWPALPEVRSQLGFTCLCDTACSLL